MRRHSFLKPGNWSVLHARRKLNVIRDEINAECLSASLSVQALRWLTLIHGGVLVAGTIVSVTAVGLGLLRIIM